MSRHRFLYLSLVVLLSYLGLSAQERQVLCRVVETNVRAEAKEEFPDSKAGEADWTFEGNRVVRIAVHFIHDSNSTLNMTTNFSPVAIGDTISGYEYCDKIMSTLNNMLRHNNPMNLPIGNDTQVLPTRYRFVLAGVYFHTTNDKNASFSNLVSNHKGELINIIVYPFDPKSLDDFKLMKAPILTGNASMTGDFRYVQIFRAYDRYLFDIDEELKGHQVWCYDSTAWLFAHEIGHSLGLHHTFLTPLGIPDSNGYYDDYCADTPTYLESVEACETDDIVRWAPKFGECCTNNLMDYAGYMVLTPDQINRIHFGLQGITKSYLNSSYRTSSTAVSKSGPYNSFVTKQAILPKTEDVTISEGENLYINADQTNILGSLTILLGGELVIQSSKVSVL